MNDRPRVGIGVVHRDLIDREPVLEDLFAALDFRRLRLRQETQLPEWAGVAQ